MKELSNKSDYWISKHRYYELAHWCMQYPEWLRATNVESIAMSKTRMATLILTSKNTIPVSPVEVSVERIEKYKNNIEILSYAAKYADPELSEYIFKAVVRGLSYTALKMKYDIPCGRDYYYKSYRKFFWILDKMRG